MDLLKAPGRTWTDDLRFTKPLLYPAELQRQTDLCIIAYITYQGKYSMPVQKLGQWSGEYQNWTDNKCLQSTRYTI